MELKAVPRRVLEWFLPAALTVIGLLGFSASRSFSPGARWFPLYISMGLAIVSAALLAHMMFSVWRSRSRDEGSVRDSDVDGHPGLDTTDSADKYLNAGLVWWGIIAFYALGIYAVGFVLVTPVWLVVVLRLGARMRWLFAVLGALLGTGAVYSLATLLGLNFPPSLI